MGILMEPKKIPSKISLQHPTISRTNVIDKNKKFFRVGIIFYFYDNGETNFIFGVDAKHWELTDLGGTRVSDEDFMDTAIREAYEESMGIFDMTNQKEEIYNNSIIVYNNDVAIIFQQVEITDIYLMISTYRIKYLSGLKRGMDKKFLENSFLVWIKDTDIVDIIEDTKLIKMPLYLNNIIIKEKASINHNYPKIYNLISKILNPVIRDLCKLLKKS